MFVLYFGDSVLRRRARRDLGQPNRLALTHTSQLISPDPDPTATADPRWKDLVVMAFGAYDAWTGYSINTIAFHTFISKILLDALNHDDNLGPAK